MPKTTEVIVKVRPRSAAWHSLAEVFERAGEVQSLRGTGRVNDQQRADLDAWFAQADDVLADWRPGLDAMVAPASREPHDGPLPRVDSYYDEPSALYFAVLLRSITPAGGDLQRRIDELETEALLRAPTRA